MASESPAQALTKVLMEAAENMAPIIDAAEGMQADMERRGWSPTVAEEVAAEWLRGAIAAAWRGQGKV